MLPDDGWLADGCLELSVSSGWLFETQMNLALSSLIHSFPSRWGFLFLSGPVNDTPMY